MKISTKGRYALRMLLDLAINQQQGCVCLKDIAQRQGISKKYLEQIVPALSKANILLTSRGFQGGYRLAVAPDKCTVGSVLRVTEGNMAPVACLTNNAADCTRRDTCLTLPLWYELDRIINEYLDSVTLQDILDGKTDAASKKLLDD